MGICVVNSGFSDIGDLCRSIMSTMIANGFTEVSGAVIDSNTNLAAFTAGPNVDSLSLTQPWRIRLECASGLTGFIRINVATPIQIKDDRSVSNDKTGKTSGFIRGLTETANWLTGQQLYPSGAHPEAHPLSYMLSISSHGIALCVWAEGQDDSGSKFSWLVVQRPVDNETGTILITGKAPVFALWSTGGGDGAATSASSSQNTWKMVVREADVNVPAEEKDACAASEDSDPVINPIQQVSIAEGNLYIITFPNSLTTQRHVYKHELDMVAYTSADVVSQSTEVDLTVYGEAQPRTYKALNANGPFNTGMRILMLMDGGGI
jgi:hypothetical protein